MYLDNYNNINILQENTFLYWFYILILCVEVCALSKDFIQ